MNEIGGKKKRQRERERERIVRGRESSAPVRHQKRIAAELCGLLCARFTRAIAVKGTPESSRFSFFLSFSSFRWHPLAISWFRSVTELYWVLLGFIQSQRGVMCFNGYKFGFLILLGIFLWFYQVLPSLSKFLLFFFSQSHWMLLSLTGFFQVLTRLS